MVKPLLLAILLAAPLAAEPGPAVIRSGEAVAVRAASGALRLSAAGKALRDGRTGDTIPVLLNGTRRSVLAVVRGPGLLELEGVR